MIEDVEFDEAGERVVVHVRPRKRRKGLCGRRWRPSGRYDRGEGRRRWQALDLGTIQVAAEIEAPRVRCAEHGPTVARLPWARHGAGHTYAFDATVAWLAVHCSKSAVCELMRIAWRTVGIDRGPGLGRHRDPGRVLRERWCGSRRARWPGAWRVLAAGRCPIGCTADMNDGCPIARYRVGGC
ncbi:hypothetical protein BJ970_004837 [Saccharopolyspora phatthalungensis]|uniref:Transposase IS204/IS1001/IS1096/IS1165 helix-turn-helix domain-containing protein n=1 Tax=Saccharopolyspora phatthalungensis TaxID=664693 RepID=A0A840QIP8_9PSEU|nr:hypothetical protein [Saccharopolyspora phatthalungensis]